MKFFFCCQVRFLVDWNGEKWLKKSTWIYCNLKKDEGQLFSDALFFMIKHLSSTCTRFLFHVLPLLYWSRFNRKKMCNEHNFQTTHWNPFLYINCVLILKKNSINKVEKWLNIFFFVKEILCEQTFLPFQVLINAISCQHTSMYFKSKKKKILMDLEIFNLESWFIVYNQILITFCFNDKKKRGEILLYMFVNFSDR